MHGNAVSPVEGKQNCALSEKGGELHAKLSKMLAIRKKQMQKTRGASKTIIKLKRLEVNKSATKIV